MHGKTLILATAILGLVPLLACCGKKKPVPTLIRELSSKNPETSNTAMKDLAEIGAPAIPRLIRVLKTENADEDTKARAGAALVKIGKPSVGPLIAYMAGSSRTRDCPFATEALELIGKDAVPALISGLAHESDEVAKVCYRMLVHLEKDAVEPLLEALSDSNPNKRKGAARALAEIGDERAVAPLVEAFKSETSDSDMFDALIELGAPAIEPLVGLLDHKDDTLAQSALRCLYGIGGDARAKVREAFRKGSKTMRLRIVTVLKNSSSPDFELLAQAIADPDDGIRFPAAIVLGRHGRKQALPVLLQVLKSDKKGLRLEALKALGRMEGKNMEAVLLPLLEEADPSIAGEAAQLLEKEGGRKSLLPLYRALTKRDDIARARIAGSLSVLAKRVLGGNFEKTPVNSDPEKWKEWFEKSRKAITQVRAKTEKLLCPLHHEKGWVRISPDCCHVAFGEQAGKDWFWSIDGVRGPALESMGDIVFSPDGKRHAYFGKRGGKRRVFLDGKEGPGYDNIGTIQFSPDSSRLAYSAMKGKKWLWVVDGKESKAFDGVGKLVFSPDGSRHVFCAEVGGRWHCVSNDYEGKVYDEFGSPAFGPGERWVYKARSGDRAVIVANGREFKDYYAVGMPKYSAEGKLYYIAVEKETKKFCLVVDGVEGPWYERMGLPHLSADGKHQDFVAREKGQWFLFRDGEKKSGGHYGITHVTRSPDGKRVAYAAHSKPTNAMLKIENKRVVVEGQKWPQVQDVYWIRFSPDGSRVAALVKARGVLIVMVDGRAIMGCHEIGQFRFGEKGGSFAFSARVRDKWYVSVNGVEGAPIVGVAPGKGVKIAIDSPSTYRYVALRDRKLYRVDVAVKHEE